MGTEWRPPPFDEGRPPPSQLSDAEVADWADLPDEEDEFDDDGGTGPGSRLVTVVGRLVDGYPVLVRDGDQILISSSSVRDPWLLRRVPELVRPGPEESGTDPQPYARRGFTGAAPPGDQAPGRHTERRFRAPGWLLAAALPAAYLLALPAAALLWWLFHDPTVPVTWADVIPLLALGFAAAGGLHGLGCVGLRTLAPHPAGLRLVGPLLTEVVPKDHVEGIVESRTSIVLRLREPEDLIAVATDEIAGLHPRRNPGPGRGDRKNVARLRRPGFGGRRPPSAEPDGRTACALPGGNRRLRRQGTSVGVRHPAGSHRGHPSARG